MTDEIKIDITVAIPAKNEAKNLEKCLGRLKRFREVIVIDSSSDDETAEIAAYFGAKLFNFKWDGKFPKKRNWFLMNCELECDWVLFLDADEFIEDAFCDEVESKAGKEEFNGYWLQYTNYFLGQELKYGVPQRKLALFKVGKGLYEKIEEDKWSALDMEIHEHPIIEGPVSQIIAKIDHQDAQGMSRFVKKHRDYALWEARRYWELEKTATAWQNFTNRQKFKYRNLSKWWYPTFYFLVTYIAKLGFLDGAAGFYYASNKAWYFQTIRLLILEQSQKRRTLE